MDLVKLGWNSFFEESFAKFKAQGLSPARIANEDKHAYVALTENGPLAASISGKLMHQRTSNSTLPKVGDWVAFAVRPGEEKVIVHAVLPRRTKIARKIPGREVEEQVLAANIDRAFIVIALDQSFNRRRLERFLVMVHEGGVQPVVVLNKIDLCDRSDPRLAEAHAAAGGVPVVEACALTGKGVKQLKAFIPDRETVVFIGPSGAGKSSLINRLYGEEIQVTIEVRERDAKGRHATTWREMIQLPWGGLVIDTPGMRECHTWGAEEGLREAFPDIEEMGVRCHFRDCPHTVANRCAVMEAVERGEIPKERYQSFLKLQHELQYIIKERKKHTYVTRRREGRIARNAADKQRPLTDDDLQS